MQENPPAAWRRAHHSPSRQLELHDFVACNMCGAKDDTFRVVGRRFDRRQGVRPSRRPGVSVSVCRCARCELVFANPLVRPVAPDARYEVEPTRFWQPPQPDGAQGPFQRQIDTYRRLRRKSGQRVALDVGAGVGTTMHALDDAGFQCFGLEPNRSFHRSALASGIAETRLSPAAIEDSEYDPEGFDLISFGAVLEYLWDPSAMLRKAARWLAPGGLIHIEVPAPTGMLSKAVSMMDRLQGLGLSARGVAAHRPSHFYEFERQTFEKWCAAHPYLEVAEHRRVGGRPFLPHWATPAAKPFLRRTRSGTRLEVWLRKYPTSTPARSR